MNLLDDYCCVFFKEHDPRHNLPCAVFDRYSFLKRFIATRPEIYRESDDDTKILTVAEWLKIYERKDGER